MDLQLKCKHFSKYSTPNAFNSIQGGSIQLAYCITPMSSHWPLKGPVILITVFLLLPQRIIGHRESLRQGPQPPSLHHWIYYYNVMELSDIFLILQAYIVMLIKLQSGQKLNIFQQAGLYIYFIQLVYLNNFYPEFYTV